MPELIELYCPFCEEVTQHEAEEENGAECLACSRRMDIVELDEAVAEKEISRLGSVGKHSTHMD